MKCKGIFSNMYYCEFGLIRNLGAYSALYKLQLPNKGLTSLFKFIRFSNIYEFMKSNIAKLVRKTFRLSREKSRNIKEFTH